MKQLQTKLKCGTTEHLYLEIALKKPELDDKAIIKATDSYIKCMTKVKRIGLL